MHNNPILKSWNNFITYALFWFFITAIYVGLISLVSNIAITNMAVDGLIFNGLLAAFGISFWYPAKYIDPLKNKGAGIFISHALAGIIASASWLFIGYVFISSAAPQIPGYNRFLINTLPWRFIIGMLFYYSMALFYYAVIYQEENTERHLRESNLKNLVTETELKSLKFQINPHFIFNSLNSMSALVSIDSERAKSMILKLAEFLRYTLATGDVQKNTLEQELKNIRLYLEIEKVRFEDKFEYVEEINEECGKILIPSLIMQPLLENAIKHAVYESLEKITLKLICRIENDFLRITLENNFDEAAAPAKKGTGIGLQNTRNRLNLIYHQDNLLEINSSANIFRVTINIPAFEK